MAKNSVSNNKPAGGGNGVSNNKPAPKGGNGVSNNKPVSKPGQATPPAASAPEVWNPGIENPTPEPFLTQQDLEEYAEAREQYEAGLHELDENYEQKKHSNEYETAEIEKGKVADTENTNWDSAARGLFRSSIRDGDLADIDATAEIKKKFLSDSLSALAVYNEGQKKAQEAKWGRYEESLNRKKVENAEGVSATMPKWQVEPHYEQQQNAPAQPQQKATTPKPKFKANEPIGFNPGHQNSKNGGITAPATDPSVSPRQPAKANVAVASAHIAGNIYGKK
jgi:hypothetical protein